MISVCSVEAGGYCGLLRLNLESHMYKTGLQVLLHNTGLQTQQEQPHRLAAAWRSEHADPAQGRGRTDAA